MFLKKHLLEGQEARLNPDRSWTAVNEPKYMVHSQERWTNFTESARAVTQSVKDFINAPTTGAGVISDSTSYIGEKMGFKYTGKAVTIGQTIPKMINNNDEYKTFGGKLTAGSFDLLNEGSKSLVTGEVASLAIGAGMTSGKMVGESISFSKGMGITVGSGLLVNNTIGEVTDTATDEVKEFIKELEEKWIK